MVDKRPHASHLSEEWVVRVRKGGGRLPLAFERGKGGGWLCQVVALHRLTNGGDIKKKDATRGEYPPHCLLCSQLVISRQCVVL